LHAIIFTFQGFEQTPGLGFGHFSFGGRPRFGLLLISLLPVFVFPELGSVLQIAFLFLALLAILIRLFPSLPVFFVALFVLLFLIAGFIALLLFLILVSLSRFVLLQFALALFVR
jgi:hypothetical protein